MEEREDGAATLTRKELYERVWATPICRIAAEFGLSDVGLAKLCRRHQIPRPPRGHWARLRHGKPVTQPPLPELEDGAPGTVVLKPQRASGAGAARRPATERSQPEPIEIPAKLRSPHPAVERTRQLLGAARTNDRGLLWTREDRCIEVRVSRGALARATRILDALVKEVAKRGGTVEFVREWQREKSVFRIAGENIAFSMEEEVRRHERSLTAKEKRDPWRMLRPQYSYTPTGMLVLRLEDGYATDVRRRWADGKRQRLEDLLPHFLEAVLERVAELVARTKRNEEERLRRIEWERQRDERLRLIREEEARVGRLLSEVEDWNRSRLLRAYIQDAIERVESAHGRTEPGSGFDRWIRWARDQADRLDPLLDSPSSILDEKSKWL